MGALFRILVFITALGTLATATAWLLARERQREAAVSQAVHLRLGVPEENPIHQLISETHQASRRDLFVYGALALGCLIVVALAPSRLTSDLSLTSSLHRDDPARREMHGLEHLARATVAQRAELDQEREQRHRSEQDLYLQQVLANQALQDKIRLGRDLHDGLIQSLYAAGLMLESAGQILEADPAKAARILGDAKSNLKAAIKDTRAVIGGLTPDELENRSLADSITALLDHLDGGRIEQRHIHLDPALPSLPERDTTELLQIIRESVSNALRHGQASRLELHFAPEAGALHLFIRDNGRGFDPVAARRGHGLDNLNARARQLGGSLEITSRPGEGACVHLSLPFPSQT